MRKKIIAIVAAVMVALATIPTNALAYIAPSAYVNYPDTEYRVLYTERWRKLPKFTKAGVTYRLNSKTHRAIVTRVSTNNAVVPNRFKAGGVWYYPDIIDRDAIALRCKKLTIHGKVSLMDTASLTWCTVTFTDWSTYKYLKREYGTWAKLRHKRCADCQKHAKDYWRVNGSSV